MSEHAARRALIREIRREARALAQEGYSADAIESILAAEYGQEIERVGLDVAMILLIVQAVMKFLELFK